MTRDQDRPTARAEATASSTVEGVETWDLTGPPSDEAFGIAPGSSAAIYRTDQPRRVRIVLTGRSIELEAVLVDFYALGSGGYTFGVRTPQLGPQPLTAQFRDVLGQLGQDDAPADRFAQQVAAAGPEQSERIDVGSGAPVPLGAWEVSPAVNIAPIAGSGRLVLGGATIASTG